MDKELKKDINQYIKEIKLNIICDFKTRKKFISDLKISIYDFVECENIFSVDEVYRHFGTPQQIAKEFFLGLNFRKIKRKMNYTKGVIVGTVVSLIGVAVVLMILTYLEAIQWRLEILF